MEQIKLRCRICSDDALAFGFCQTHYAEQLASGRQCLEKDTAQEYIRNRVIINSNGCWLWQKSTHNGYGTMAYGCPVTKAHIFSWKAFGGLVADGMQLNHKCHNRSCVNPSHLYLGTQVENMRDMYDAGRQNILRGEKSGVAKLNDQSVRFILNSCLSVKELREKYGVSDSLIRAVKERKIWTHICE